MGDNFLRVELHSHTTHSWDGHISFEGILRTTRRRRIDVLAITDHDTIEGALDFKLRVAKANPSLHIIVGEERTLSDGSHVIGLFLREAIRSNTLVSVVEEIQGQGAVCVFPHPFRNADGVFRFPCTTVSSRNLCFEIFNPKCSFSENQHAHELIRRGWVPLGGSDAHFEGDIGHCINLVPFQGEVNLSLRQALTGSAPMSVLGVRQKPGAKGRRYAPKYYQLKSFIRVPTILVPTVKRVYRLYYNTTESLKSPRLEVKYANEEGTP